MVSCGEEHTICVSPSPVNRAVDNVPLQRKFSTNSMFSSPGKTGQVFIFGDEDLFSTTNPIELEIPETNMYPKVTSVVGGSSHSLILLSDDSEDSTGNKLLGLGSNAAGQLGPHVPTNEPQDAKSRLRVWDLHFPVNIKVSMISCAQEYSALVLKDRQGSVIIMGQGLPCSTSDFNGTSFQALARGNIADSERVVEISAGFKHLLLLTNTGTPYAVGDNRKGQLGCDVVDIVGKEQNRATDAALTDLEIEFEVVEGNRKVLRSLQPIDVSFKSRYNPVQQLAAGEVHSMLLTRDGNLYSWGANTSGQLGIGSYSKIEPLPKEIKLPMNRFPVLITCGNKHSVILDIRGEVLCFGENGMGQTGSKSTFFAINRPQVINTGYLSNPDKYIIHIAAGKNHTAVLGRGSELAVFGDKSKCAGGPSIHIEKNRLRGRRKCCVPLRVEVKNNLFKIKYKDLQHDIKKQVR
eukprot:augustus_masked-scaffold_11-processed-gene-7.57-mRNA-1 protein AED:0.14 eAED:0.88 QI:0/-1/0/1/-1/1/1/0/463